MAFKLDRSGIGDTAMAENKVKYLHKYKLFYPNFKVCFQEAHVSLNYDLNRQQNLILLPSGRGVIYSATFTSISLFWSWILHYKVKFTIAIATQK